MVGVAALGVLAPVLWTVDAARLAVPGPRGGGDELSVVAMGDRTASRLGDQLDPLPLFMQDLPDPASKRAASDYAALRLHGVDQARAVFDEAWAGLQVPPSEPRFLVDVFRQLLFTAGSFTGPYNPYEETQSDFDSSAQLFLAPLRSDPRNADRLSNAAAALFAIQLVRAQLPFQEIAQPDLAVRARWLLRTTTEMFPDARAAHLNLAFVTSVNNVSCGPGGGELKAAVDIARTWLVDHPDDRTARVLTAGLASRDLARIAASTTFASPGRTDGLGDALWTLQPLLDTPATAALGTAATGDAYVAAAAAVRAQAPYLSRDYARQAAGAYRRALASAGDPGLLVGMGAALDMSGDQRGALAALRRAVTLAPDSPEVLLALAAEQEKSGAFRDAQRNAERVLSKSVGMDWSLRDVRYVKDASVAGERGYLGFSVGADRAAVLAPSSAVGCGAGGFAVLSDPIPSTDDPFVEDLTRWGPLPNAALSLSLAAATVVADVAGAATDLDRWEQLLTGGPKSSLNGSWLAQTATLEADALGPRLAAGRLDQASLDRILKDSTLGSPFAIAFRFTESRLRHAGAAAHQPALFSKAAAVCHAGISNADVSSQAKLCEAESTYYAGDPVRAAGLLGAIGGDSATTLIEEAFATWRGGDPKQADQLLQAALEDRRTESQNLALASLLLGELMLDQAQPSVALRYIEQSLRTFRTGEVDRAILEHAENERGLALLWSAQRQPDTPPDCGRRQATCLEARDDFLNALAVDPSDPLALQNLGWAQRLLGDDEAARRSLADAVRSDPADYPALNDLGWLAAGAGDQQAARRALEEALDLRPDDDIAAWNLGIVLLQAGPAGIPRGEAYLARAIREDPALREHPLGYLTDERIYRRFYGAAIEQVSTAPLDQRVGGGALATGVVGAAGAILAVTGVEVEHRLGELLAERELPFVGALLARLRRRRNGARPPGPRRRTLWSVLHWAVTAAALTAVAIWTAWPISSPARGSILVLALGATALALLVHESAQVVAGQLASVRFRPVWPGRAIAISLALLPFGVADGPFPGHAATPATPFRRARWVYAAGIVANLGAAALFYGLYRAQPLPALRLLAEFQLAAAAFSLLPLRPLDASAFQPHRAEALLLVPLALLAAVGGYAFRSGLL